MEEILFLTMVNRPIMRIIETIAYKGGVSPGEYRRETEV